MPALGRMLREHKLAANHSTPSDFAFSTLRGTPMQQRNVGRRGLDKATERAKLNSDEKPRFRFHDLRHSFASLLIAQGADVVFVSRQLGHANPSITLSVYAHLFEGARHAEKTSALLEAAFGELVDGTMLETTTGEQRRNGHPATSAPAPLEVVDLQGYGDQRRLAAAATR
jgi:hypothetical protein